MKPLICSALLLALITTARAAPSDKSIQTIVDPDGLIASYRQMELPLPPEDAPLVRFEGGSTRYFGDEARKMHQLGFLLKRATEKTPALLLIGTRTYEIEEPYSVIDPQKAEPESVESPWGDPFPANAAFAISIQLRARGYEKIAQTLQDASLKMEAGDSYSPFRQPAGLKPKTALAVLAWTHWMNEITRPSIDRAPIAKRMKALIAADPALNTDAHKSLLHSLKLAIIPSKAAPDSPEALIDSLVELDDEHGGTSRDDPDPRYLKLAILGFRAIPALLDHLDDQRLTRCVKPAFNNFAAYHLRVGHIVSKLVQELAADDFGNDWLKQEQGWTVDRQAASNWWTAVKAQPEEDYFVSHVLPKERKPAYPYAVILHILAAKYPAHLPDIYTDVRKNRGEIGIEPIARVVASSSLPREQKLQLFLATLDDPDFEKSRPAYWELKDLDPKTFAEHLAKKIDSFPKSPAEPYWKCGESSFASLAVQTDDPRVWKALLSAAKRADGWLRMQYLEAMGGSSEYAPHMQLRLNFLSQFLDDSEARQSDPKEIVNFNSKFSGPFAGSEFPRLEVRDFAAMTIASVLKMPDNPHPHHPWSAQQWMAYRARVNAALKKELKM